MPRRPATASVWRRSGGCVDLPSLEGRTLVEGIAEAFRHPEPDCPDPIAELQSISDDDMERICGVFVRRMYPEGKFSRDERERMGHAFRHRFIERRESTARVNDSDHAEMVRLWCVNGFMPRSMQKHG